MTYKNLEGESLRFLMFTMNPEWSLIEQTLEATKTSSRCGPATYESQFFPQFERDKFLQVDPLTEAKVFSIATGGRAWRRRARSAAQEPRRPTRRSTTRREPARAAPERRIGG
jgi:hypothetical protein